MLRKSKKEKIHLQHCTVFIYTISLYFLLTRCIIYINIVDVDVTHLTNIKCKNDVDVTCVTNARHKKWKDDVKKKFTFISALAQSCPTLCDSMKHSTPGLPVYHQLPEFVQTHVHLVSDAI